MAHEPESEKAASEGGSPAEASAAQLEAKPEVDYGLAEAAKPAEDPAPAADVPEGVEGAEADEAPEDSITQELAQLKRELAELREAGVRLRHQDPAPDADEFAKPPIDPKDVRTYDDLLKIIEWQGRKQAAEVRRQARLDALAVNTEQQARGVYSSTNMGKGYAYDDLVGNYIAPLERQNPALRSALAHMENPAAVRYALAFVARMVDANGGDMVKTYKDIRAAIEGNSNAASKLAGKVQKAQQRAALRKPPGKPADEAAMPGKITAEYLKNISPADFIKLRERLVGPLQ